MPPRVARCQLCYRHPQGRRGTRPRAQLGSGEVGPETVECKTKVRYSKLDQVQSKEESTGFDLYRYLFIYNGFMDAQAACTICSKILSVMHNMYCPVLYNTKITPTNAANRSAYCIVKAAQKLREREGTLSCVRTKFDFIF